MLRRKAEPYLAFTLIELLVVIGIICLLAAILFPVFNRVRQNSYRTACQSNLKQMNLAIMQYCQDYDEHFPVGLYQDADGDSLSSLDLVQPYLKSQQISICPADSDPPGVNLSDYTYVKPGTGRSSYTANDKICTVGETPPLVAIISQPTRIPLMWDAYIAKADEINGLYLEVKRRHFEGANCAFVDGHVKWYKSHPTLADPIPGKEDDYWNAPPDDSRP